VSGSMTLCSVFFGRIAHIRLQAFIRVGSCTPAANHIRS